MERRQLGRLFFKSKLAPAVDGALMDRLPQRRHRGKLLQETMWLAGVDKYIPALVTWFYKTAANASHLCNSSAKTLARMSIPVPV